MCESIIYRFSLDREKTTPQSSIYNTLNVCVCVCEQRIKDYETQTSTVLFCCWQFNIGLYVLIYNFPISFEILNNVEFKKNELNFEIGIVKFFNNEFNFNSLKEKISAIVK